MATSDQKENYFIIKNINMIAIEEMLNNPSYLRDNPI